MWQAMVGRYIRVMVVLIAHMYVQPGKVGEALEFCRVVRGPSLEEPGCQEYDFYQSPDETEHIVFAEQWSSRAALEEHFQTPHFKAFAEAMPGFAARPPKITVYAVAEVESLGA